MLVSFGPFDLIALRPGQNAKVSKKKNLENCRPCLTSDHLDVNVGVKAKCTKDWNYNDSSHLKHGNNIILLMSHVKTVGKKFRILGCL